MASLCKVMQLLGQDSKTLGYAHNLKCVCVRVCARLSHVFFLHAFLSRLSSFNAAVCLKINPLNNSPRVGEKATSFSSDLTIQNAKFLPSFSGGIDLSKPEEKVLAKRKQDSLLN